MKAEDEACRSRDVADLAMDIDHKTSEKKKAAKDVATKTENNTSTIAGDVGRTSKKGLSKAQSQGQEESFFLGM